MIRKFLIATILSSMCLLVVALHDGQIEFITITNQDNKIFDQNLEFVESLSSRKKYNGVMHYSLGARTSCKHLIYIYSFDFRISISVFASNDSLIYKIKIMSVNSFHAKYFINFGFKLNNKTFC